MAMNIFELFGTIAIKNEKANKKIADTAKKAEGLSGTFTKIGELTIKFGSMLTKGVGIVGAAWTASVEGSREYRTEMGKLNSAFMASGHTTETAANAYRTLYGVIGQTDQAVEAAQQIALLANAEKDVAEWAGLAAGVAGRFGDALMPETFYEAANETIKLGEATGAYVQMLEGVGMSVDGFNAGLSACSTEAEKQAYILGVTRAALGDASDAYNKNNKDIIEANRAQGDLTDTMSKIGEYTEPAMTKLKEAVTDMVETALPYLKSFMEWTTEHGEETKAAIMGIATAMAVAAVAAHPYAAAVAAVVAGLAWLNNEEGRRNMKSDHLFDGRDQEAMAALQEWVEAKRALKEADDTYQMNVSDEEYDALVDAADAAAQKVKELDGELIGLYEAWRTNQENGLEYLDVPLQVSEDSEANMQAEISNMNMEGVVKLLADTSSLQAAINATGLSANMDMYMTGSTPDGSHASGLPSVPYDGYIARVHKDEAILNKEQADAWRGGGSAKMEALLAQIVNLLSAGQVIQLDSGIMAGQLTPAIDARLGVIQGYKERGN